MNYSRRDVIELVQIQLAPTGGLASDGVWGEKTEQAYSSAGESIRSLIEETVVRHGFKLDELRTFSRKSVASSTPGVVNKRPLVGFPTTRRLMSSSAPVSNSDYKSVVLPLVASVARSMGFSNPSLLLAQMDFESANGKKLPASHNYTGIKTPSGSQNKALALKWAAVAGSPVKTIEGSGSEQVRVESSFLSFPSARAFVGYYLDFLSRDYPNTKAAVNANQFVDALRGRNGNYFTDSKTKYASALDNIARSRYSIFA